MKMQRLWSVVVLVGLAFAACGGSSGPEGTSLSSWTLKASLNAALTKDVAGDIGDDSITAGLSVDPLTGLVASFTADEGAVVSINGLTQVSGVTANDFSRPVVYTVTAANGSSHDYTATLTSTGSKLFHSFSFTAANNPSLGADVQGILGDGTITAQLPFGSALTGLKATFEITGESVAVGGATQTSGSTVNDFTNPVTYTVTAKDGTTKPYVVTVTAPSPAKDITLFEFSTKDNPDLTTTLVGTINGTAITVSTGADMPTLTNLKASFVTTGANVTINGVTQISHKTVNDFSTAQTYVVTAADGTKQSYVVTVSAGS